MFDKEFFPTPEPLIKKLLKPYLKEKSLRGYKENYNIQGNILEPSAGKGDICKFLEENIRYDLDISVIESNLDLQTILQENYPLISSDFLSYNNDVYWDFIIMNPPFSNGDEHLLKAIEIGDDTKIACILNAETIRNPYTNRRKKLLSYIEENGSYEFVKDAFKTAERKTGVEVALIWINVPEKDNSFDFDFISEKEVSVDFDFDIEKDLPAREDMIGNLRIRYEQIREAYKEKIKADNRFDYYVGLMYDKSYMIPDNLTIKGTPKKQYSHLSTVLKKHMWNEVISHLDIKKYMSSNIIENFDKFIRQQSNMSFTKDNVFNFFDMIMANRVNIIEQAIVDVFENLTKHAYLKDNRQYVETWKTNDAYKINRRIISPSHVRYGEYQDAHSLKEWGSEFSLGYSDWNHSKLSDLDKVMAYINGDDYNQILTIRESLEHLFTKIGKVRTGEKFQNTTYSTYFEIKFYKKGTIHLKFRDEKLWNEFNMRACAGKNWLPNDERREWEESKKKDEFVEPEVKQLNETNINEQLELFKDE